jgi:integrase
MPTNKLLDSKIRAIAATDRPQKFFDGGGLFLFVSPKGAKVWRLAYRVNGKAQTATIGPYPLIGLAEARKKRDEIKLKLLDGEPLAKRAKRSLTLSEACGEYWGGRDDLSASYLANAKRALEMHIEPKLGAVPVADLTREQVLDALKVMDAAKLYEYVRKTRMWLSQVLDWAVENGHAEANVAATIKADKAFGKAPVEHFAAVSLPEVPALMQRIALEGEIQSVLACRLLALTWTRTVELRMMEWSEIHGDQWVIPAGKMKRRREHVVPLTAQAMEIIENMRARSRGSPYVFPGDHRIERPMSENAILYLLHRCGYKGRMTGHGFRSVASTWANDAGHNPDAIERQLAHVPADMTRAAYNRAAYLPQRRAMLQAWADWLMPRP